MSTTTTKRRISIAKLAKLSDTQLRQIIRESVDKRVFQRVGESDILQEVILEGCCRSDELSNLPERHKAAWLKRIARRICSGFNQSHIEARKRSVLREEIHNPSDSNCKVAKNTLSPSDSAIRQEREASILTLMQELGENDRTIIEMRHWEAMSNSEIAEILNVSEKTASKRYWRAMSRLSSLARKSNISIDIP